MTDVEDRRNGRTGMRGAPPPEAVARSAPHTAWRKQLPNLAGLRRGRPMAGLRASMCLGAHLIFPAHENVNEVIHVGSLHQL